MACVVDMPEGEELAKKYLLVGKCYVQGVMMGELRKQHATPEELWFV